MLFVYQIIEEASALSDYMTPQELSIITAVSTSCLLSFLLPQCNSTQFLRAYFEPNLQSLDERLYPYPRPTKKSLVGDQDDHVISASFYTFLEQGLGALLASGRAFAEGSTGQISWFAGTDLLLLLAMAICPSPLSSEGSEPKHEEDLLRRSTFPYAFHLVYADRIRLVRLCAEDLVIPECFSEKDVSSGLGSNLVGRLAGAIEVLRNSLIDFASYYSQSAQDASIAYKALVNVTVREGNSSNILFVLKRMLDKLSKTRCKEVASALSESPSDLIIQYNGSRYYADGDFTRNALDLLTKCIHERVEDRSEILVQQNEPSTEKIDSQKRPKDGCRSYHYVAFLKVAKALFYFIIDIDMLQKIAGETLSQEAVNSAKIEKEYKFQMIHDVLILLTHPSDLVVKAAADLLALAFAYDEKYFTDMSNIRHVFKCTKRAIENLNSRDSSIIDCLKGVIYSVSRRSETYAYNLLSCCVNQESCKKSLWHISSIISSAQPSISTRVLDNCNAEDVDLDPTGQIHKALSQFSCSMARCSEQISWKSSIEKLISEDNITIWALYQLARQCFVTSNFDLASDILEKRLLKQSAQQSSFLWLNSLVRLAKGEAILRTDGHLGIPSALSNINACHSIMLSLASLPPSIHGEYPFGFLERFNFQADLLAARVQHLQLVVDARSTCLEYALTSTHCSGSTRTKLHLNNLSKCFTMLGSRYMKIYELYGLHCCQQSRSALRGLVSLCYFLGEIVDMVFPGKAAMKSNGSFSDQNLWSATPTCDANHPMGILLSRLRARIAELKNSATPINSEVVLEVVDALLKCPVPFPSSFFVIKPIAMVYSSVTHSGQEPTIVAPGAPFTLEICGIIPSSFIKSAKVSFNQVLAWISVCFESRLADDEDLYDANERNRDAPDQSPLHANKKKKSVATTLLPGGKFVLCIEMDPILQEGYHRVNIELGCRDVCCGEWLLPSRNRTAPFICVTDR